MNLENSVVKKVCHMTSAHDSYDVRIFYKECSSLARAGYDTYLVACGKSREENGVHVIGVGNAPTCRFSRMILFTKKIYENARSLDADIYHLHDPELIPYGKKLKKKGKKVILDCHEDTVEQVIEKEWIPKFARPLVSVCYQKFAFNAYKIFDGLISVTPHIVEKLKIANANTWLITNYPILKKFKKIKKSIGNNKLCFTGGIDTQWCHDKIIESITKIDDVCYILCGYGKKPFLDKLKQLSGWSKVQYWGMVPHEIALTLQQQANIGMAILKPSNNSGWITGTIGNTKLFEYMMAGLPVICTNFILWLDIIERYKCGICVKSDDVNAITDAIVYLISHPEEANQMGKNGRRAVEQEFNWETQEKKLLEFYWELKK